MKANYSADEQTIAAMERLREAEEEYKKAFGRNSLAGLFFMTPLGSMRIILTKPRSY